MAAERALVIGGGIAGLLAATVLSKHVRKVVLFERDRFPDPPAARRHVPQGKQLHVLLARGAQILQELYPDLGERLAQLGFMGGDFGADMIQCVGDIRMPRKHVGIPCRVRRAHSWSGLSTAK